MAISSGIFNSVNKDRKYNATHFAEYFATFIGNGIFPNPSDNFKVVPNEGMSVNLSTGKAWINGYYIFNDAPYNLRLDVADGIQDRIDRIVLQLNFINREIVPVIKKGSLSSSPVAPALQRDDDIYELALADIYVAAGAISINQQDITDLRLDDNLCGIVKSTIKGTVEHMELRLDEMENLIDNVMPSGLIVMWSGTHSAIPTGWHLCNGQNGTPDLRDRFILGATVEADIGETGGQHEVTLTVDQMPSHSHSGSTNSTGNHRHSISIYGGMNNPVPGNGAESQGLTGTYNTSYAGSHSHSLNIDDTGGGQPHENRPAFYKLAFIMKA